MKNKWQKNSWLIGLFLLSAASNLLAQEEAIAKKAVEYGWGEWALENIVLLMGAATIVGAFAAIMNLSNTIIKVQQIQLLQEHGAAVMEKLDLVEKEPWWKRLYDKSWSLVPVEKEKDILLNHDYDGIKELDNVLPPWWLAMFWGCVVIGFAYLGYYHVWDYGLSSTEQYALEMEHAEERVAAFLAKQADNVDENSVVFVEDDTKLSLGQAIYTANCAACHGQSGEGGIGPNLTDPYWLHGGTIAEVFKTVKYGVPAKGMIAWKSQLRPSDIQNVASYILTLQGSNPPNAKEPQGDLVENAEETPQQIGMK
ncbi:MAG: cbb3-type cytochrome c oxidase N-terminal domain-containing protein [Bacteroidota bacterium]